MKTIRRELEKDETRKLICEFLGTMMLVLIACGVAVAAFLNGYTQRKVEIELLGGKLNVEWNQDDNHIYMTGPATTVYTGEIDWK